MVGICLCNTRNLTGLNILLGKVIPVPHVAVFRTDVELPLEFAVDFAANIGKTVIVVWFQVCVHENVLIAFVEPVYGTVPDEV